MNEKPLPMLFKVRLGAQPINWCNDDMTDLGDEYSFEAILDETALAGYTGTELGRKYPRDAKLLQDGLRGRGLVLTSPETVSILADPLEYARIARSYLAQIAGI